MGDELQTTQAGDSHQDPEKGILVVIQHIRNFGLQNSEKGTCRPTKDNTNGKSANSPKRMGTQISEKGNCVPPHMETPTTTPKKKDVDRPKRKLFHDTIEDNTEIEIVPTEADLEFLLVNSCKIDAIKVQTIVENFIRGKKHTSIFCMTETKVPC